MLLTELEMREPDVEKNWVRLVILMLGGAEWVQGEVVIRGVVALVLDYEEGNKSETD